MRSATDSLDFRISVYVYPGIRIHRISGYSVVRFRDSTDRLAVEALPQTTASSRSGSVRFLFAPAHAATAALIFSDRQFLQQRQ